jgi:glycosyltransferase involved in cell wall biosynthesis
VLDLIEHDNGRYHRDNGEWLRRREQVRRYLRQADGVTAISADVLGHVASQVPGMERERLSLTPLGLSDFLPGTSAAGPRPFALSELDSARPFLLCLGNDFLHKNRDFAIRVWSQVRLETPVDLVFAGQHVGRGSSAGDEHAALGLASRAGGDGSVRQLGHVPSADRLWLLQHAAVVLYPTSAEGFGLVPFEAAQVGTPTVVTRFGPFAEHLPQGLGCTSWSVAEHAAEVLRLLQDPEASADLCTRILSVAGHASWDHAGSRLAAAFVEALAMPPQPWGLWERTGLVVNPAHHEPDAPLTPARARRAAARIQYGPGWWAREAGLSVRGRLRALQHRKGT